MSYLFYLNLVLVLDFYVRSILVLVHSLKHPSRFQTEFEEHRMYVNTRNWHCDIDICLFRPEECQYYSLVIESCNKGSMFLTKLRRVFRNIGFHIMRRSC
jgi:vancomycin permeability regulator SanA